MYNSAFRVSLLFFSALMIRAPAQTAPSGAIAGIVLDAGSNSPLRRAVVTLSTVEAQPQDAVAWTDSNGRFSFGYLAPGRYMLRGMKNGYQGVNYGADSVRRPPAVIRLAAGEVRNAHVLSATGAGSEPISAILWPASGDPGFQQNIGMISQSPSTTNVPPGRYYACGFAVAQPWNLMQSSALRTALESRCEAVDAPEGGSARVQVTPISSADLKEVIEKIDQ